MAEQECVNAKSGHCHGVVTYASDQHGKVSLRCVYHHCQLLKRQFESANRKLRAVRG